MLYLILDLTFYTRQCKISKHFASWLPVSLLPSFLTLRKSSLQAFFHWLDCLPFFLCPKVLLWHSVSLLLSLFPNSDTLLYNLSLSGRMFFSLMLKHAFLSPSSMNLAACSLQFYFLPLNPHFRSSTDH